MTKENSTIYLLRREYSKDESVNIRQDEYLTLRHARRVLSEIADLEEKYFAVCEHYREIEEYIFSSTLRSMIFTFERSVDIHSIGAGFGRLTASFLSSVRLYQDTLITHIGEISDNLISKESVKRLFSKEYDESFAYRVMETLRNHSQHRAFPVHTSKYKREWNENRTEMTFSSMFFFNVSNVDNDKKFKKAIKDELKSLDESFDLKDGVRRYFASICRIHSSARDEITTFRSAAIERVAGAQEKWASVYGDDYKAVVACGVKDGLLVEACKPVYIGPDLDEYRISLENRTRAIMNMELRKIKF